MPSPTLVIQTAFLGDVVLTIPLLQALAAEHGPVDVVTTPGAAALIETHPSVRRVIRWDKHGKNGPGAWGLGKALKAEGYTRVYLPHRSLRSALIATLTGAPERIGFSDAPLLSRLLYTATRPRHQEQHESVRLLSLSGGPPAAKADSDWRMTLTAADAAAADTWMRANGLTPGFIAMAPGSIWGTKRWPYYPELAALLDRPIVVIGGPEDAALGDLIVAASSKAKSAVGQLSLRQSAALIQQAALLVTNDSAPLHLATAVGTPILAIFGPTVPAFGYGPIRPGDRVAELAMACRPCSLHGPQVCPLGHHKCMKDQSPERILSQVRLLLGGTLNRE